MKNGHEFEEKQGVEYGKVWGENTGREKYCNWMRI